MAEHNARRRCEWEAAERAWDGPHTCSTCGYDINGGESFCTAPGCDGTAKGALLCRSCLGPVAPQATCTKLYVVKKLTMSRRAAGSRTAPPVYWMTNALN